jgi:chaperone modulatory protein CbpM
VQLVELGVLQPAGTNRRNWRFPGDSLHVALKARRLQQDLDLNLSGVALVLELLEEVELLRSRLQALEGFDN